MDVQASRRSLLEWLALLEVRHPKAIDLGLERCRAVWQRMGSPKPADKIFIVAGTNGKGSTGATICGLLDGLGYRHASYTSPHLYDFNERVLIGGKPVSDARLIKAFGKVEAARAEVSLTYFEFTTLAAFCILSGEKLDYAVLEVGLGGRLDAVNLLDADCAVITPVGLDHQEYLGNDLVSIGREKAGVIRAGRPVVCGQPDPPASIKQIAMQEQASLKRLGIEFHAAPGDGGFRFCMGEVDLVLPLPRLAGSHQLNNAATGLASVLTLIPSAAAEQAALAAGLQSVRLPGRLQRVDGIPAVWIDVGHNPMAAKAVSEALREITEQEAFVSFRCVLGMLADKDAGAVASELDAIVSSYYCAGIDGGRGQTGQQLADHVRAASLRPVRVFADVAAALETAMAESGPGDGVLVFGSFLTASQAGRLLVAAT